LVQTYQIAVPEIAGSITVLTIVLCFVFFVFIFVAVLLGIFGENIL